jgi:hypothetical protein
MTDGNPFDFTAADWRSATCLRAKVHGTVAPYRPQLACPERRLATVEALHRSLTRRWLRSASRIPPPSRTVCCFRRSIRQPFPREGGGPWQHLAPLPRAWPRDLSEPPPRGGRVGAVAMRRT